MNIKIKRISKSELYKLPHSELLNRCLFVVNMTETKEVVKDVLLGVYTPEAEREPNPEHLFDSFDNSFGSNNEAFLDNSSYSAREYLGKNPE